MIIAGNLKTNHTRESVKSYMSELNSFINLNKIQDEVYIFPPLTTLDKFKGDVKLGVQNAYPLESGSCTGEVGLEQLSEFNIDTILIGHSERRHILQESNEFVLKKFNFFKERSFKIFYCIGEPLEVRERGLDATLEYIDRQLDGVDLNYENLIIAYEPVWAIGTGVSAKIEDIKDVSIKLKQRFKAPLLYGGSVKPNSVKDILDIDEVDGVLIGTASWKIDSLEEILTVSKKEVN